MSRQHLLVGEDAMSHDALFQLGMDSAALKPAQKEENIRSNVSPEAFGSADHFIERDGILCAGSHLIIDLFEAERLDDIDHIAQALMDCVDAAGATLLHLHLHPFEPNGGVSGVAVLAESHISIHSWPERGYAALDVFMCGEAEPERCIGVLRSAFRPQRIEVKELLRGKDA
jgi:S-adenosylmethionine decarboxylase